jgi:hypothetical protein
MTAATGTPPAALDRRRGPFPGGFLGRLPDAFLAVRGVTGVFPHDAAFSGAPDLPRSPRHTKVDI